MSLAPTTPTPSNRRTSMPYSEEQTRALAKLSETNLRLRHLRDTLEARLRAQLEAEVRLEINKQNELVYLCVDLQVRKADIARDGLHTTNRGEVYKILDRRSERAPVAADSVTEEAADAPEFDLKEGAIVRIRPAEAELAPILPLLGFGPEAAVEPLREADFKYQDGRLVAVTESWTEENGRNPVIALVQTDGSPLRGRLNAWAREKGLAA